MAQIKVLPELVSNKIAAGEVIERPASIVKELVENALDAGAKNIEIAIRHGGKSLIRVSDDGCGMDAGDSELAFKRYATSKITQASDLSRIASFGFRGEALPSIAAVSRTKLVTRTHKASSGTEIIIEGGKTVSVKPAAAAKGTTIEVRDLFFNTPARRKFLKTDSTEASHVTEAVSNIALSRRDVRFTLQSNDKKIFELLAGESGQFRAATVMGADLARDFLPLEANMKGIKLSGFIAKPRAARANRSGQIYFINGRWVRAFQFAHALQAGYHGLLMHGQYPVAVLFLDVDLERVDVNVHPTKLEVRISGEAEIKNFIKEAVAARLAKEGDLAPEMKVPVSKPIIFDANFRKSQPAYQFSMPVPAVFSRESSRAAAAAGVAEPEPEAFYGVRGGELEEPISLRDKFKITKILGQIHSTFLIAETEEGMLVIDQHAAHERVQFEALVKSFDSKKPAVQRLLMEEVLEIAPKHKELFKKAQPLLARIGFDIEAFGGNSWAVRAVPSIFNAEPAAAVIRTFLEEKEDGKLSTSLEKQKEEIAALIACKKKSCRAYDPLAPSQIKALLESLSRCDNPFSCPHGRPSFLKYTFGDLEKQFKRKL